jgi:tetratricopeptide (TPR) repeat protein
VEAAEAVCEEPIALDYLEQLRECSLVLASETDSEGLRFRMLETLREYGLERLAESNESEVIRYRHLSYFLTQAEAIAPRLTGPEQGEWLARLEAEHDNMRAALDKSSADDRVPGMHLRLCGALWRFWFARGHVIEGRHRCGDALGQPFGPGWTGARATVLMGAGSLAWRQADYGVAQAFFEESLALYQEAGDQEGMAYSFVYLGNVAYFQGNIAAAKELHEKSMTISMEMGRTRVAAASLCGLGDVALNQGNYSSARALYEESLDIFREVGDRTATGLLLCLLGDVARFEGDPASARSRLDEALTVQREIGNQWGIAVAFSALGLLACEQGDYASARTFLKKSLPVLRGNGDRRTIADTMGSLADVMAALGESVWAAQMWGATERLREEIGSPVTASEQPRYMRRVSEVRVALGDDAAFESAWQDGRKMTWEAAVTFALE